MKKCYIVPQIEEMKMEPVGVLMGSYLPPDPAPRRRGDVIE